MGSPAGLAQAGRIDPVVLRLAISGEYLGRVR